MPAHDPVRKDKEFGIHILVVDKTSKLGRSPDGHVVVKFEWHGGTRTWRIEGVLEPESPFMDDKHNWRILEKNIPQGQGEAMVRLIEWLLSFTCPV